MASAAVQEAELPAEAAASASGTQSSEYPRYPKKRRTTGDAPQLPVMFGVMTDKMVNQLKHLVQAIFPVRYNEKFYKDTLASGDYSKLDILVGAICCRKETGKKLYIMTIGVLAPYRGAGVGTSMLESVIEQARSDPAIDQIYLHVQVNNDDALKFYARHGFVQGERIENYYQRIEPSACFVLRLDVTKQEAEK